MVRYGSYDSSFYKPSNAFFLGSRFTPFDEFLTAKRTKLVELNSAYGLSNLRDIQITQNGGSISFNNEGELQLDTSSDANSLARLESAEICRYIPGYGAEIDVAFRPTIRNLPGNLEERWGYFDPVFGDGFYFGRDSRDLFVGIRRNSNEFYRVHRGQWDIDNLDGNGPSGLKIDVMKGYTYQIMYSYSYDTIMWAIQMPFRDNSGHLSNLLVGVHSYHAYGETMLRHSNLPISVEVTNNGSGTPNTVYCAGRQYNILGDYTPNARFTTEIISDSLTVPGDGSWHPIVAAHRRDSDHARGISLKVYDIQMSTDVDIVFDVRTNCTALDGTDRDPTLANPTESALVFNDTLTTASGGEHVWGGSIPATGNKESAGIGDRASFNLDLIRTEPMVIFAKSLGNQATILPLIWQFQEES